MNRRETYITNEEKKGLKVNKALATIGKGALICAMTIAGGLGVAALSSALPAALATAVEAATIGVAYSIGRNIFSKNKTSNEEIENSYDRYKRTVAMKEEQEKNNGRKL